MYEFQTSGPIMVSIKAGAGTATVTAEERDGAVVEVMPLDGSDASRQQAENTRVDLQGDTLVIHAPEPAGWIWRRGKIRVTARVPLDSGFEVHTASADVDLSGRWRDGSVTSASGDVRVETVTRDLRVSTASGDVQLGGVGGDLKVKSASGDVAAGSVGGDAVLNSASGDLSIHDTGGSVQARTASGDIELLRARRGDLHGTTASGDVSVSVLPGTGVYMDVRTLSGSTYSDLDLGDKPPATGTDSASMLSLRLQTASGDITVLRSPAGEKVSHT